MIRQAVVLAGGKGSRLRSRLGTLPKPLVDVLGVPLLERQVLALQEQGISDVVLLVNHQAEQISDFCRSRSNWGLRITLIDDGQPMGTAGAVLRVLHLLDSDFLVVYGDTLFDLDLGKLVTFHERDPSAAASLFLHPNDHPHDSDLVRLDSDGVIVGFHGYPHAPDEWLPNLVNAAFYVLRRDSVAACRPPLGQAPIDFAKDLFPDMAAAGVRLRGYGSPEYIKDIGTPQRLDRACRDLASGKVSRASLRNKQTAVFLDRDGTLNRPNGHIASAEALDVYPFAARAVKQLNDSEYRAVVVTNQPVLARGECSPEELARIHAKLETILGRDGAFLDRIYVCPHHPDSGFPGEVTALKVHCDCRKPKPGLLLRAQRDLNVDLSRSWLIGDSATDMAAATAAGITAVLVQTGGLPQVDVPVSLQQFECTDAYDATTFIVSVYAQIALALQPAIETALATKTLFVSGLSKSGKSTAAHVIARELRLRGHDALVISLDRWLRPEAERAPGLPGRYDVEGARRTRRITARRSEEPLSLILPDLYPRSRRPSPVSNPMPVDPGTILIWEGVIAHYVNDGLNDSLFIDTNEVSRRQRVIAEYILRGRSPAEAADVYASRVNDEHEVVLRAAPQASLRVSLDGCHSTSEAIQS